MHKFIFIVIVFCSIYNLTFSQNTVFAPEGALWKFYEPGCLPINTIPDLAGYGNWQMTCDETVEMDGYTLKKMVFDSFYECGWFGNIPYSTTPPIYIYEEDEKIFVYENNDFLLLYDFSLQTGDTMWFDYDFETTHPLLQWFQPENLNVNTILVPYLVVDEITDLGEFNNSGNIGEVIKYKMSEEFTELDQSDNFQYLCLNSFNVLKGVGNFFGFFGGYLTNVITTDMLTLESLICYNDTQRSLDFSMYAGCDGYTLHTSSTAIINEIDYRVFGNYIEFPDYRNKVVEFTIYNINGQTISKGKTVNGVINKPVDNDLYILQIDRTVIKLR